MTVKVVCDGDSVVAGVGGVTPWPSAVAGVCNTLAGVTPTVTNKGLTGQTSYQMLWGASGSPGAAGSDGLTSEILSLSPDVVMAQMATLNDSLALAAGTTTLDTLRAAWRTYVNTVLAQTAPNGSTTPIVCLCDNFCYQLLSTYPRPYAIQDLVHEAWVRVMSEYANNPFVTVIDPYLIFRRAGVDTSGLAGYLQSDTVHPNSGGYGSPFTLQFQYAIASMVYQAHTGAYDASVPNPAPLVATTATMRRAALLNAQGEYALDDGSTVEVEVVRT